MTKSVIPAARRLVSHDRVHIERLNVSAIAGPDSWDQLKPQNMKVTLRMDTDFKKSSLTDDLKYSLNYAVISRDISNHVQKNSKHNFKDVNTFGRSVLEFAKRSYTAIEALTVEVESNEANIRCSRVRSIVNDALDKPDLIVLSEFKILTLVGVFTFERLRRQYVDFTIQLPVAKANDPPPYDKIIEQISDFVENSNFKTVEALVETVAQVILTKNSYFLDRPSVPIEVKVIKLNAITQTDGVGVSCKRCYDDFKSALPILSNGNDTSSAPFTTSGDFDLPVQNSVLNRESWKTAILAFGSNIGDRFQNIVDSIGLLSRHGDVEVLTSSSLFESEPMYFKDQQPFLNGCVKIKTTLLPDELLKLCKKIEYDELNRVKHFDNGPRTIDLDIITYYDSDGIDYVMNTTELTIPHPRILERSFVLEPLCELIDPTSIHPITAEPFHNHLRQLYEDENPEDILWKLVPVGNKFLRFKNQWEKDSLTGLRRPVSKSPAYLMGVVNVTPDSFSDGSNNYNDKEAVLSKIEKMLVPALELHELIILDIGGCSTRPGSLQVSEKEELSRVLPIIQAITSSTTIPLDKVVLSIDTYRSAVAEAAISAGVGIINDISGGTFEPEILGVLSKHPNVAYVLSHIRGDIESMSSKTSYLASGSEVVEYVLGKEGKEIDNNFIKTIGREICSRYKDVLKNKVHRWQLILDPGIGFAKIGSQNLDLIRGIPLLKNYSCIIDNEYLSLVNLPVLLGPSRKKFIGDIAKIPRAEDRDFATGAIVSTCVGNGSDIIRVHAVSEISKSLKLINELYRN
ncbi:unnamed protein product [Kluyveromyces dobzhanskii CBS 2104]|uniref:Folic acid synthesis protein fol1 n=1 Tax=Kluyveromyces dobzhanskii CBS 2104 TaxID=1427455 RepID=A0A0A8L1R1_9SACH|nr:unnamed protein product [Kluyveromyces dobzhanskii CBS 2104]